MTTRMKMTIKMAVSEFLEMTVAAGTADVDLLIDRAAASRQTITNFINARLLFSVGMVGTVGCIPFVSRYFTSDPLVITVVNSVVRILVGVFATHGTVCALEGKLCFKYVSTNRVFIFSEALYE